jgi:hypothetical protein
MRKVPEELHQEWAKQLAPEKAQQLLTALEDAGRLEVPVAGLQQAKRIPALAAPAATGLWQTSYLLRSVYRPAYALVPLLLLLALVITPRLLDTRSAAPEQQARLALAELLVDSDPLQPLLDLAIIDPDLEVLL